MTQKHNVSIFASFDTDEQAKAFLVEHAINQSIPKGGNVFSFSRQDESVYRDLCNELLEALELVKKHVHVKHPDYKVLEKAIAKAQGQS